MCDRCEIDMKLYGEIPAGFRCSDVSPELLNEEANGIPRFPRLREKQNALKASGAPEAAVSGSIEKTDKDQ